MAGKFITFEGGEGAGKSTHIRRLAERLTDEGQAVTITREPGGTPAAEAIRKLILSGSVASLGAEAEAVLFAAARADHVDRLIRPALDGGRWVLCDRFADSTHVYQGATGGVVTDVLDALDRAAIGETRPDLTVILDVPADVGLRRASARRKGGEPDRFEREDLGIHERRREAYLAIARREPERCILIDATRPEAEVADAIWQTVSVRLLKRAA